MFAEVSEARVTGNFNCLSKGAGRLKVTVSHVHCTRINSNVSEVVKTLRDIGNTLLKSDNYMAY